MIRLPRREPDAVKPMIAARSRAVNASGINKMPMTEIASSIKKGTIINVARNPQKNDFILLVWMAPTTASSARGVSSAMISAIIRIMAKKHREITLRIKDQPSSSPLMAELIESARVAEFTSVMSPKTREPLPFATMPPTTITFPRMTALLVNTAEPPTTIIFCSTSPFMVACPPTTTTFSTSSPFSTVMSRPAIKMCFASTGSERRSNNANMKNNVSFVLIERPSLSMRCFDA